MSSQDLNRLVTRCQRKNNECNVTGLLLYSAGHFIQLLEGHQPVLENLFAKISRDPRHHRVERLHLADCKQRLFPAWQMGLLNIDGCDELDRSRLLELARQLTHRPDPRTIAKILLEFRRQLPTNLIETEQVA